MVRVAFLLALSVSILPAQNASITGRITDPSGAVIPGARVSMFSETRGVEMTGESNEQGYYNLVQLMPGTYTLGVQKEGFATQRQTGMTLEVNQVARIDLVLRVGGIAESIGVESRAVLLETESTTLGQVVQSKQILELPLLGRNPYALAGLAPGVRISAGMNDLPVDQISTA